MQTKEDVIVGDTLLALAYLTNNNADNCQLILKHIEVKSILPYITQKNLNITNSALKLIGNLCAENDESIRAILEADGMQLLKEALNNLEDNNELQRDICWIVSNIAAVSTTCVQQIIDSEIISDLCCIATQAKVYYVRIGIRYCR
jgi:hypothetical protein